MQYKTKQLKLQVLREVQIDNPLLDNPERIANYFQSVIKTDERLNLEVENFFVLFFNVRRRIIGYSHIAMGTLDSVLISPRGGFLSAQLPRMRAQSF